MPYKADEPWKSERVWAAIIMLISVVLVQFGIEIDTETQQVMVNKIMTTVASVGGLVAIVMNIHSKWREKKKASGV